MPVPPTAQLSISIHALRGEGDGSARHLPQRLHISIHALRGEGDPKRLSFDKTLSLFLSTPSVGRATFRIRALVEFGDVFLSTPSVGRATTGRAQARPDREISIHALRGEGDHCS